MQKIEVQEYIASEIICKCIFATHYHELNYLKNRLKNVENYHVMVNKLHNQLDFCHRIEKGGSNKSYGIEAARLAGVPHKVISKANFILDQLEASNEFKDKINIQSINNKAA